jgi:hypothetical protein
VTQALRAGFGLQGREIVVAAFGTMTVPALVAAALGPEINRLYLAGGLSSYRSIVNTEDYRHTFANFVPNILAHTDLPEIVASLAPRRVLIAGAVDAKGASHSPGETRNIYTALKSGHLELRDRADWSAAALKDFCS